MSDLEKVNPESKKDESAEEFPELEGMEVSELEDDDLEDAAGGGPVEINGNCGC